MMKSEGFIEKEGFPKEIRIKKDLEFKEVIKKGEKKIGEKLILFILKKDNTSLKFGIRVDKTIKKATKRNRIKRIIREILRKSKDKFLPGERVVIVYKSLEENVKLKELQKDFDNLVGIDQEMR